MSDLAADTEALAKALWDAEGEAGEYRVPWVLCRRIYMDRAAALLASGAVKPAAQVREEALAGIKALAEAWTTTEHIVARAFASELRAAIAAARGDE